MRFELIWVLAVLVSNTAGAGAKLAPAPDAGGGAAAGAINVKQVVDSLQAFYEKTNSFEARFQQTYHYASFNRTQQSSGKVVFVKPGVMRWDYEKPDPKTIVVAKNQVVMFDPEAQELTRAPLNADKLSASVTFLWGKGKLQSEFDIRASDRTDLGPGTVLELNPKKPDARFQKIFFVVDSKFRVNSTVVIDPDGSENHMEFSDIVENPKIGHERFEINPPPGTHVNDMVGVSPRPTPDSSPLHVLERGSG